MKFVVLFVSLMLAVSCLPVCTPPVEAQSRFRVGIDVARYRGDSTKEYVEVYYSFDVSKLKFVKVDTTLKAEAVMEIYFKRSANDSMVAHQIWRIPFAANDSSLLGSSRTYADVLGFFLAPDVYRLYVVGGGSNDWAKRDSFSVPLDIQPIERKHVTLSDIELCSSIVSVGKDSVGRFIKNTYEVKPNPSRIYGGEQPVVYYYVEAYNLLEEYIAELLYESYCDEFAWKRSNHSCDGQKTG